MRLSWDNRRGRRDFDVPGQEIVHDQEEVWGDGAQTARLVTE